MKKKSKNKLDNGAIAKLASITSSAITTFKEKQKQKQKELAQKRKKEEFSKLNLEKKEINKKIDQLKKQEDKISIKFGEFLVAENGSILENLDDKKIKEYMKWDSINIEINLNLGSEIFHCYTCDFTHDYIDINADYKNST